MEPINNFQTTLSKLLQSFLLVILISGCGSSGNDSNSEPGRVVKGVISHGLVDARLADNNTLISQTRSDEDGYFSLDLSAAPDDALILLSLSVDSETRMLCDLIDGCLEKISGQVIPFGDKLRLPSYFQLLGTTTKNATLPPSLTPLSHVIVKTAQALPQGLNTHNIETATSWVREDLALEHNPLTTPAIDLTSLSDVSDESLKQAILGAALYKEAIEPSWLEVSARSEELPLSEVLYTASELASQLSNHLDEVSESEQQYANALNIIASNTLDLAQDLNSSPALQIQTQPQSLNITEGQSFSLSVTTSNDESELSYQWRRNGQDIFGANARIYYVQNAQVDDTGLYSVAISNGYENIESLDATITVEEDPSTPPVSEPEPEPSPEPEPEPEPTPDPSPTPDPTIPALVIQNQPQATNALESQSFSLTVRASGGTGSYTYQWKKNGENLVGETSNTYYVSNAQVQDSGTYKVVVTSDEQNIESSDAIVTIESLNLAPSITQQPSAVSVNEGETISLNVFASGSGPIAYQWQKNGSNIPGAQSSALTIADSNLSDAGSYRVSVSNDIAQIYSNLVFIEVVDPINPSDTTPSEPAVPVLKIQSQPQSTNVLEGESLALSVLASGGTGSYSYQWRKNGANITNANTRTYSLTGAQVEDSGVYNVLVYSGEEQVLSLDALIIVEEPLLPVTIGQQPSRSSVNEGEEIRLSVVANGGGTISYQWQKGGSIIPGETDNTLIINPSSLSDAGSYRVLVSNTISQVYSEFVDVIVNQQIDPPSITTQPSSITAVEQNEASFSVNASGDGFLAYQWHKDGTVINGAYDSTYTIDTVTDNDAGTYNVTVSNSQGSVTSVNVTLEVIQLAVPVTITQGPSAQDLTIGDNLILSVTATGDGPLSYQWLFNGQSIQGSNSQTLTINSITNADAGRYSVIVSNNSSSEQSQEVIVNVASALSSVGLSWTAPSIREDGSALASNDISGYIIEYGYNYSSLESSVSVSTQTNFILNELIAGTLYVRIATIDTLGTQGEFSDVIEIEIP